MGNIRAVEKESKIYSTNIENGVKQYFTTITKKKSTIDSLITSCELKIDKIEIQETFDFELLTETLKEIEESISTISKTKSEQLLEFRKRQNNLTTLVKGAIGLEIRESSTIEEKLEEVKGNMTLKKSVTITRKSYKKYKI